MAVPSSGQLREYADIGVELGVAQTNVSLRGMSQTAGFSAPDAMSEFYGYSSGTQNTLDILGDGSCIATYTQNNTGNDLSGNYNANVVGASYIPSIFDTSQDLNGARWMDCQNTSSINYANISFSLWFRSNSQNTGNGMALIGKGSATNFIIFEYAGFIYIQIKQNGVFNSSAVSFANNQWYYLTFTISGGNTFKLYLNGVLQWTGTGTYPQTSENLQIGRSADNYWQKWNGQIDQIRVFNKALSQSEINIVYAET